MILYVIKNKSSRKSLKNSPALKFMLKKFEKTFFRSGSLFLAHSFYHSLILSPQILYYFI